MLPDVLDPGLKVVFCGTAVGDKSHEVAAYYANPRNKFWKVLHATGFTPLLLSPNDYPILPKYGLGLTDLVKTRHGNDNTLTDGDFDIDGFNKRIFVHKPKAIAFNGKTAAIKFLRKPVNYGRQTELIGSTVIFVLPSTSGLASRYWDEHFWHEFATFIKGS